MRAFVTAAVLGVVAVLLPATGALAAVDAGTRVVFWGNNADGQFDVPADLTDAVDVSAGGQHAVAVRGNGTVVAWGANFAGQLDVPADLSDVTTVAAGVTHTLALRADGTVVAWGQNLRGQTDVPVGLPPVVGIAAGTGHSVAVTAAGTVVTWGSRDDRTLDVPVGLTGVVAVAAGSDHTLALKDDGTVVAWGLGLYGSLDVPADLTGVVAIEAASAGFGNVALKADGTVVTWGQGSVPAPADLTDAVAVAYGGSHALARRSDGSFTGWGSSTYGETTLPPGVSGVIAFDAGGNYNLAVVRTEIAPPGQVQGVTATAGPLSADVTWTAPTTGGPVDRYDVSATLEPAGPTHVVTVPGTARSATISGLYPGWTYSVSVVAQNAAGASPRSVSIPVTPTEPAVQAARITGVSEQAQVAAVGSAFPLPLTGVVVDRDGNPLADVPVEVGVVSGAARFAGGRTDLVVRTDAAGRYTTPTLRAGRRPGPVVVQANPDVLYGSGAATYVAVVRPAEPGSADLRVAVSSVGTAAVGRIVPITVRVRNTGTAPAAGVTAVLALPPGLDMVNVGGVSEGTAGEVVALRFGTLDPGESAAVVVDTRIGRTTRNPARLRAVVGSRGAEAVYRNNVAVTVPLTITR